jgi:hypothetical protein
MSISQEVSSTMLTEKSLRDDPSQIKALTGLPSEVFWELVNKAQAKVAEYERERLDRPDRQRAVVGAHFDQLLVIRIAQVLTYLRLHIPQGCILFGEHEYIKGLAEATAAASPSTSSAGNMGKGGRGRRVSRRPGFRAGAVG